MHALLKAEHVLTHNLIVGAGTIAAGVLGVAFQSLVSHQLRPADYGSIFAVVTMLSIIGLPAGAFTLLMARETSRDRARGHQAASAALLSRGNRALLLVGLGIAGLLVAGSPFLAGFLSIPVELLLAAAVGIPFALAFPLLVGVFQGEQRFVAFSLLLVSQAAMKLLGALTLGTLLGPFGIVAGISLGSALVYAVAIRMLRRKLSVKANVPWWRPAAAYIVVIVPSTLALAVLLSADILLVKHFFPTRQAGEYAAVAAVGRAIFFGATGIAGVLFPKVIFRESQGHSGSQLIVASLLLVALGGLFGLGLLSLSSTWLLTAFAGSAYSAAAGYLPWYALGMTMLGGATILLTTQQSRGKPAFLAVLLPLTLLEPALLIGFHQNLMQVVQVVDLAMALLLAGLAAQFILQQRASQLRTEAGIEATASHIPQIQVSR